MPHEYGVCGLTETRTTSGDFDCIRATISEYNPESYTGFHEPCEHALVTVERDSSGDSFQTAYVSVLKLHSFRRLTGHEREWVTEVIINETTAAGELVATQGSHHTVCQYSTSRDVTWGDVLDDVLENASVLFR